MFYSDSVYFLGFRQVVPKFCYNIHARFEFDDNKNDFYKCEVVVEKQNGVLKVISVGNFEKKLQNKYKRHDLPWKTVSLSKSKQQEVSDWFLTNQAFSDVLLEEKWLSNIIKAETIGEEYLIYKIGNDVRAIENVFQITLSTDDSFPIDLKIHEYSDKNYIGSISLYKVVKYAKNKKNFSLQDQKNEYLAQLLADKVLKETNNKVRLYQVTTK